MIATTLCLMLIMTCFVEQMIHESVISFICGCNHSQRLSSSQTLTCKVIWICAETMFQFCWTQLHSCEIQGCWASWKPLKTHQYGKVSSKLLRTHQKVMVFGKSTSNICGFTFSLSKSIFEISFGCVNLLVVWPVSI